MNTAFIILAFYMIITTGINLFFAGRNKDSKNYFVGSQSLGITVSVALLFSEIIAGAGTIGNAAGAFVSGVSSVWANWGMTIGTILFVICVGKFYRAISVTKGVMSVPEAFYYMFDSRCRIVMMIVVTISYLMMYSTQAVAAAALLSPILGIDRQLSVWIITAMFIITTVTGGIKGIAAVNVIHACVMYLGMLTVAIKSVGSIGGLPVLFQSLPSQYFNFMAPDIPTTVAYALGTGIAFLAASNVTNVTFGAKSLKTANTAIIMAGLLVIPFALLPSVIGMCARVVMPDIVPNTALFSMAASLGSGYGGVVAMAIVAAIWSTAPALLLIICASLTKDFYKTLLHQDASEKQQLYFSKTAAVVIGIIGSWLGMKSPSILNQILGAFQIRSVVGIVLLAAIVWPRVTPDAAFWSMLISGVVAAVWHFTGNPFGLAPLWPSALVCLMVLVPITKRSPQKRSDGYLVYRQALAEMVKQEHISSHTIHET